LIFRSSEILGWLTLPPPSPLGVSAPFTHAHKCRRTYNDGAYCCCRHIVPTVVTTANDKPKSQTVAEETLRGPTNRSSLPSALPCVNDDFSLPTPEIRLLIAIKLVRRLKLTQETRLMSVEDL
jgi:hypothetical protein